MFVIENYSMELLNLRKYFNILTFTCFQEFK